MWNNVKFSCHRHGKRRQLHGPTNKRRPNLTMAVSIQNLTYVLNTECHLTFFFLYTFFYSQGGRSNYILCQVYARSSDNRCLHFCAVVYTGFIVPCFAFEFGIRSLSFKFGTFERCYLNISFEFGFGLVVRRQKWDCIYFNNYVWRFANQFKTFNGYFVCITFINQLCSHVSM